MTAEQLLDLIEGARLAGHVSNDQARAASVALGLEGHEAMLFARLASGSDPASQEYLATGKVSELVARAHCEGPGVYTDPHSPEACHYLLLCGLSADEARPLATLRERFLQFQRGTSLLCAPRAEYPNQEIVDELVTSEREKIRCLPYVGLRIQDHPFRDPEVHDVTLRLYASDRGHAAAYWDGQPYAAVFHTDPRGDYLAVGTRPGLTLAEAGILTDKALSTSYGLIFRPEVLAKARELLERLSASAPGAMEEETTVKLSVIDHTYSGEIPYFTMIGLLETDFANWYYLAADGTPTKTGATQTLADLAISLAEVAAAPLPHFVSGRLYVSFGMALQSVEFGADGAIVMPSENTNTDPNYYTIFDKIEFTYKVINPGAMLSVNTTLVDGFGAPIDVTLEGTQKGTQNMGVLVADREGLFKTFVALPAAFSAQLVTGARYPKVTNNVRMISPTLGVSTVSGFGPQFPSDFLDSYIAECWSYFAEPGHQLVIDMQAAYGTTATGSVGADGSFDFSDTLGNSYSIARPTTADVLGCSGPFVPTGSGLYVQMDGIVKRTVGAAMNRGVLTRSGSLCAQPFYRNAESNKYAEAVHEKSRDGQNYAFSFDDVCGYSSSMGDTEPTELKVVLQPWNGVPCVPQ
jgi:hypothetical protein